MLLLQRIEALEKALNQKQIENDLKKEWQIPVLAANDTGGSNGKKETNRLGNSGTKEEARIKGNNVENVVESDTEDDEEETEDDEEEDSVRSDDDDDVEGEEERGNDVEKEEEQRLIAIRNQLHRTREAWHADQGTSSRQGQGQGQGIGHAAGSVQRDVQPTVIKSKGSDSRGTSRQSSSQGPHEEKDAADSRYRDKVKIKDRSKEKREDDVSRMEGKAITADGTFTVTKGKEKGNKRKGAGQGLLSDIGHSGRSQTQDLYAAQLARLMSMAEEVISRK